MTTSRFKRNVDPFLTKENALKWEATDEKWLFVTDEIITAADIDYDPHGNNIDRMVRYIEIRFEKILKGERIS